MGCTDRTFYASNSVSPVALRPLALYLSKIELYIRVNGAESKSR